MIFSVKLTNTDCTEVGLERYKMVVFGHKFHRMNYQRNLLFFSNDHLLSKSIDFSNENGIPNTGSIGISRMSKHTSISSI